MTKLSTLTSLRQRLIKVINTIPKVNFRPKSDKLFLLSDKEKRRNIASEGIKINANKKAIKINNCMFYLVSYI